MNPENMVPRTRTPVVVIDDSVWDAQSSSDRLRQSIIQHRQPLSVRTTRVSVLTVGLAVLSACGGQPMGPDVFWDSTKITLVALYDSAFSALNAGQGCSQFSNDDGTLAWAESYLLHSLLDMFESTRNTTYLDQFVRQANEVAERTDIARGLSDYRGRSTWAWSATRYSVAGERGFWLVNDTFIAEPLARFAHLVRSNGLDRYNPEANRFVNLAELVLEKYGELYRHNEVTGEGQYLLEAGFPAEYVMAHPDEEMPLPLNHDAAAGRLHIQLWRAAGAETHRQRAEALGRRLKSHLIREEEHYVWQYFGRDGDALFFNSWADISHGAMDVRFAALLEEDRLVFEEADLEAFRRTLLGLRTGDGFLRFVKGDEPDFSIPDPKCGHIWDRTYSDASALWLPVADTTLYSAIFDYVIGRMATPVATDPYVLNGLSQLIAYYPTLGAGNAELATLYRSRQ